MKPTPSRLPKFGDWLLRHLARYDVNPHLRGDFDEEFSSIYETKGFVRAWFWYWTHLLRSLPVFVKDILYWRFVMIRNYLKIVLRNIKRNKGYSFINIGGLALGIACSVLVFLYVHYELSYDDFHVNASRLFRITSDFTGRDDFRIHQLGTPRILEQTIRDSYPQVEKVVQLSRISDAVVKSENAEFKEPRMFASETTLFEAFTFPFLHGNIQSALDKPLSVVITKSIAVKYFGNKNALGEILSIYIHDKEFEFRVMGIMEDVPLNSHFRFDLVISREVFAWAKEMKWEHNSFTTYLLLLEGTTREEMEARLTEISNQYLRAGQKDRNPWTWSLMPIRKIHLHSNLSTGLEPNGSAVIVSLFVVVAGFILFIACINYINLSTARSIQRAREVAVRKVLGSDKRRLVGQFLCESVLFAFFALFMGMVLIRIGLPLTQNLTGRSLIMPYDSQLLLSPKVIFFAILIGLAAGLYPASLLSSYKPVAALKSASIMGSGGWSSGMRGVLVVFQFAITILLIICTLGIQRQMSYTLNKRLGFDKENILIIPKAEVLGTHLGIFKERLRHLSDIIEVTSCYYLLGSRWNNLGIRIEGLQNPDLNLSMDVNLCDPTFLSTLGMEMYEGRFFSAEMPTDSAAMVINEEAVRYFGIEDPIGKKISIGTKKYTVIGVLKNIHYESLHTAIRRMAFILEDSPSRYVLAKIRPENMRLVIDGIRNIWSEISGMPFEFLFLDEQIEGLYQNEIIAGRLVTVFSSLAIVISCLGLFGLASFTAEQRKREIGIRKVLGASIPGILMLISREFVKWVLAANVIAIPIAYIAMNKWLQNFEYRTYISSWTFVISVAMALLIALISVSYQSVKAATANPVDSLRYE